MESLNDLELVRHLLEEKKEPKLEASVFGHEYPVQFVVYIIGEENEPDGVVVRGEHIREYRWDSKVQRFSSIPYHDYVRVVRS
jgi:hypothetical protein